MYGVAAYALDDDNKVDDAGRTHRGPHQRRRQRGQERGRAARGAQRRATSIDAALKPVLAKASCRRVGVVTPGCNDYSDRGRRSGVAEAALAGADTGALAF